MLNSTPPGCWSHSIHPEPPACHTSVGLANGAPFRTVHMVVCRGGAGWEGRKPEGESWALLQPGGQLGFTPRETPPPPPDQPTWGSQGGKRPETNPDQRRPTQTNPDGAHTVRNKLRPTRISLLGWQMSCRLLPPSLSLVIAG